MNRLIHSSKFQTMILDVVISLAVYFVTKYVAPAAADDVLMVLGLLQPVVLAVIVGTALEDYGAKRAGNDPRRPNGL